MWTVDAAFPVKWNCIFAIKLNLDWYHISTVIFCKKYFLKDRYKCIFIRQSVYSGNVHSVQSKLIADWKNDIKAHSFCQYIVLVIPCFRENFFISCKIIIQKCINVVVRAPTFPGRWILHGNLPPVCDQLYHFCIVQECSRSSLW